MRTGSAKSLAELNNFGGLDYLKFICSLFVAAIHLNPMSEIGDTAVFVLKDVVFRVAVPSFFLISGYFLFGKLSDDAKMKKYLMRILILYAVYTVIYLPLKLPEILSSRSEMIVYFRKLFVYASYVQLWYLLSLLFVSFVIWILYKKLNMKMKSILIIFALLHFAGILISTYRCLFDGIAPVKKAIDYYYYLFFNVENGVFFGIYVVIGCVLKENASKIKNRNYSIPLLISAVLYFAEKIAAYRLAGIQSSEISFFLVPAAVFLFLRVCFTDLPEKAKNHAFFFRKQSTLIFLWHMFISYYLSAAFLKITGIEIGKTALYFSVITVNIIFASVIIKLSKNKRFSFLNYLY